jgi:predicted RNA-binding Zn-ribbon protein involved in translation (DUF1610 family)
MVTIVKHEWHQHDRQYAIEIDEDILSEIYPDLDEDEVKQKLVDLENGEITVDEIVGDAYDNDVELEWDFQYDDCWTDRKGGYEVTYEMGDEDSWVEPDKDTEPTHKCTKCRWTGQSYNTLTQYLREDGTVIEDYYSSEEESDITKDVCPMCDNDIELTEAGVIEEKEKQEREACWAKEDEGDEVICYSCDKLVSQNELIEMDGQYICPHCGEGWVEPDNRDEVDIVERTKELEKTLEELKREFDEFDKLTVTEDEEDNTEDTQWPFPINKPNELTPNVKWPFENAIEVDDEEEFLEDLSVLQEPIKADPEETLPNYPAGEYTIRIWGRTREIGVSKIKKAQYKYWSDEDHENDLSDALNENYDYEENKTPKAARFDLPYYEYQDKISFWGFDEDDTHVTITNGNGVEIYEGDMGWFEGEEVEELYPEYLGKGHWLMWTQGGKGSCMQVTIDTGDEEFDPNEITFTTWDVQGSGVINRVQYQGVDLEDEGMDSEYDNWRGQWSEFSVHENL